MSVLNPTGKYDELYMIISFKALAAYNAEDGSLVIPDNTSTCSSMFSDIAFHHYFRYGYQLLL